MEYWILWLVILVLFIILEALTVEVVSIWFSASALICIFLDLAGLEFIWQIFSFALLSIIFIIFTRPIIKKYLIKNESKTNVDALIGEIAIITKDVLPDERGEACLKGKYWLAVSENNEFISEGSKVNVKGIEGATLIVKKY